MSRNDHARENSIFTIYETEIFNSHSNHTFSPVAIDTKHNIYKLNLYKNIMLLIGQIASQVLTA